MVIWTDHFSQFATSRPSGLQNIVIAVASLVTTLLIVSGLVAWRDRRPASRHRNHHR